MTGIFNVLLLKDLFVSRIRSREGEGTKVYLHLPVDASPAGQTS